MPLLCESEAGCTTLATVGLTVLAPTGETITTDSGTDPVLGPAFSSRLCVECAVPAWMAAERLVEIMGGHVDTNPLEAAEVLELDPITLAKASVEAAAAWAR